MYEVECAFRRENGGLRFIREEKMDEASDEFCKLRVFFQIDEIYPEEADTGAAMDWSPGGIASIEMRNLIGWSRGKILNGEEFETAERFLQEEFAEELEQAETDEAESLYFGEAA
jgi:hypothetical protein